MTVRELLPPLSQPLPAREGTDIVRRRRELGAFLRHRRSVLQASDVGLPDGMRRHVRGLRREEVAQLAGISASWYTLLEQGRVPHVSGRTLNAVAEALQFSLAEHEHLQVLAQAERPAPQQAQPTAPATPPLSALLSYTRNVRGAPTYLTTAQFDVIAWNPEADALLGFSAMPPHERNLLLRLLAHAEMQPAADSEYRRRQRDTLKNMVGVLRANYGRAGDAAFDTFIEELRLRSREFRRLWREQTVALLPEPTCTLLLPSGAFVTLNLSALVPIGHPGHLLICLTPTE